ncbi:acyl-CoA thioesterase [Streptosporangium sp. DT93]|uniref:acyl-CoA thioesterase n=1 Tax=Streptosporangium sp. DT93 TaxID=3393428 RepID=UPI003CE8ADCA
MSEPRRYRMEHLVTYGETSAAGTVYFAHLIRWQGECRESFGYAHCPAYMRDLSAGRTMVTSSASCEYLGEIHAGDRIAVRLSVPWIRLHFMQGEFTFHRVQPDGDELVARGEQLWANAHRVDGALVPAPWPAEVVRACARFGADVSRALVHPITTTRRPR